MAQKDFFPLRPASTPQIYAYSVPQYPGLLKVGYTSIDARKRIEEQFPVKQPGLGKPYRIELIESAMREDGTSFMDYAVHRWLEKHGKVRENGEWYRCTASDVRAAVVALRSNTENDEERDQTFSMRPEQKRAVEMTMEYFKDPINHFMGKAPHFLWNCKMRFGKTFATYQLAKAMGWKKVLILTFKPAVQSAWEEDLKRHVDFEGWQFLTGKNPEKTYDECDRKRPIVCFGSFQDFLGKNSAGGIKLKNEWAHAINWDCIVLDEYHYGAWRENAKDLFYSEDNNEGGMEYFDEDMMPITTDHYLYLSGTPFRAINSGEFIEDQIYNWTYGDEQEAKEKWGSEPDQKREENPYTSLSRMVLMTYQLPQSMVDVALQGEFDEFDINEFFGADKLPSKPEDGKDKKGEDRYEFRHKEDVQKWLDLIRGQYKETIVSELKQRDQKPPMPFSHAPLLQVLNHTFWFLPSVASCYAMAALLQERQNVFYQDYKVIVAAGTRAGIGLDALAPVQRAMGDPLKTRSITLSCGKLTTGVTVRPWTGIFMLRSSSSPETYFQAAFRVQSPWTTKREDGTTEILKNECYVFDFAPDRALRQVADYSCRLNIKENKTPDQKVFDFIKYLPVLAYKDGTMKRLDPQEILDIVENGTSATLLARRWESALLVNVDNITLQRLLNNEEAMRALMKIEGFRSLNSDIEAIINRSEKIKKLKAKANDKPLTQKEKKQLTDAEKEMKSKRKMIQEKLIKFATRIPVFMFLTDYREQTLQDVIRQLEPGLFQKVTGLDMKDFELLVSLNVFNSALMNDAVYKFKRYEDSSLSYAGFPNVEEDTVGLWDTTILREEFDMKFFNDDTVIEYGNV